MHSYKTFATELINHDIEQSFDQCRWDGVVYSVIVGQVNTGKALSCFEHTTSLTTVCFPLVVDDLACRKTLAVQQHRIHFPVPSVAEH